MARPKKNVEETKEINKRKAGRPKKVKTEKAEKKVKANFDTMFDELFAQLEIINKKVDELDKIVKDINEDLDTVCEDIYCDCDEKTELKEDTTDKKEEEVLFTKNEVEQIIRIINFLNYKDRFRYNTYFRFFF